jgi:hypothetical protein
MGRFSQDWRRQHGGERLHQVAVWILGAIQIARHLFHRRG